MDEEEIVEWYEQNISSVQLPDCSSQRQYRFKCSDGVMRKVKRRISRPEQLLPFIKRWKPIAIYYTVAKWLNPVTVGPRCPRKGYVIADNCILGLDLIFDVDNKDLEKARQQSLRIIENVQAQLKYITFSGSKGFHLVFEDNLSLPCDPRERETFLLNNRKVFIVDLINNNIEFDKAQTLNTRQILKVPGTLTKTGATVTKLTKQQLQQPITQIITNYVPFSGEKERSGMLKQIKQMTERNQAKTRSISTRSQGAQKAEGSDPTSPSIYIETFITNKVQGTKDRYTLFLHYPLKFNYKKDIKHLRKKYDLKALYTFQDDQEITVICPQTFQHKRLLKILNSSKSIKQYEQTKFKKQFIAINKNTQLIQKIEMPNNYKVSQGHINLISKFVKVPKNQTEGTNKLKQVKTKYQTK